MAKSVYLECIDEKFNEHKYYKIEDTSNKKYTIKTYWGPIGNPKPTNQEKEHDSADALEKAFNEIVQQKLNKGYIIKEITGAYYGPMEVSREIKKATRKKKATKDNHNNNSTNNLSNINGGQKKAKKAHTGIAVKSGRGAGTANAAPSLSGGGSSNGGGGNSKKGVFDEAWNVITMPENLRDTEAVVAKLADLGLQRSDQLEYLDINDDDTDELLCLLKTVPRKEFLSKLNAALTN